MSESAGTSDGAVAPRTLPELLHTSATAWGGRNALIAHDECLSYSELVERSRWYSRALIGLGVGKGTHVGLLLENCIDWVALTFAVTGLGGVLVPLSTFCSAEDLRYQLRMADVNVLLMTRQFLKNDYLEALQSVVPELDRDRPGAIHSLVAPALRRVVVRGEGPLPKACDDWDVLVHAGDDIALDLVDALSAEVDPGDACYLLTTSGTTASPKGVLLTHAAVVGNGQWIGDCQALTADDVVWHHFPLFFSAGCCNVLLGTLSHGAALILHPVFDAASAIDAIERHRATTWHLWPHVLKALLEHPDWVTRDHSSLHKGTGPFDLVIRARPADGLGGVNMYGMTETATAFSCTSAADPPSIRLKTQGMLRPGNEVKVIDPESGVLLGLGQPGEIHVKGPSLMRGYYKVDPAATFDNDGFFPTGDLGFVDADGRLHFEHRLKDMIKTAGVNVSPADVEAVICRLDGVAAAFVFPLPSEDRGEVVGAAVVARSGATVSEATVLAHCREQLATFKRPVAVLLVGAADVPMTGSGKVQKYVLRDRLAESMRTY